MNIFNKLMNISRDIHAKKMMNVIKKLTNNNIYIKKNDEQVTNKNVNIFVMNIS